MYLGVDLIPRNIVAITNTKALDIIPIFCHNFLFCITYLISFLNGLPSADGPDTFLNIIKPRIGITNGIIFNKKPD